MKNKLILIFIIIFIIILIFSIYMISNKNSVNVTNNVSSDETLDLNNIENDNTEVSKVEEDMNEGEDEMLKLNIKIGNQNFTATLYDNETTRALINKLPLSLNMSELNGNEKYYYFNSSFPTASERVRSIKSGDLMLYGSDCLVLFYDSFSTPYSYTRIGYIDNPSGLDTAVGKGGVQVTFEMANN